MSDIHDTVRQLVIAMNNLDQIYSASTTKIGRQPSELWLMYALDDGEPHSQKQICDEWGIPRTTLNTTIKKCEAAGHLTLSPISGKRREMQICLTENGKAYAKSLLDVIYLAESRAMEETIKHYSSDFIFALDSYGRSLKLAFEKAFEQSGNLFE